MAGFFKRISRFEFCFLLISLFSSLTIYLIPVRHDIPMLDHESLISTLKQMHTLTEYFQALGTSKILDIQPVRDASHYIDLKINSLMGIENFGLIHNIILLFIITYLLFKISTYYQLKSKIYLASIFLIHPAIFHVFVEETSRKHILSFLFSLLTLYIYLKTDFKSLKSKAISFLTFTLSVFSHPISLYLPVALLISSFQKDHRYFKISKFIHLFLISIIAGVSNLIYYKDYYPSATQINKILFSFNLGDIFLNIGRYPIQFFYPFNFSLFYGNNPLKEYLGLILLVMLIFFHYKKVKSFKVLVFMWSFFFGTMLILYHNGVDINYLNTYILVPSLTFLFFIGSVTQGFSQKKITLIFSLIFAVLLPTSVYYSLLRINKHDFYLQSYLNQPTCRNLHSLSYYLAIHGPKDELLKYSQVQIDKNCMIRSVFTQYAPFLLLTVFVYVSPEISLEEKKQLIRGKLSNEYDLDLIFEALESNYKKDYELKINFDNTEKKSFFLQTIIGKDLLQFCEKKTDINCMSFKAYVQRVENKDVELTIKRQSPSI